MVHRATLFSDSDKKPKNSIFTFSLNKEDTKCMCSNVFSDSIIGFVLSHCHMTDVIRQTGSLEGRRLAKEGGSRIAARHSSQPEVLHGAESSGVQLTQLTSGQHVFTLGNTWNIGAGSQTLILSTKRKHQVKITRKHLSKSTNEKQAE